MSLENHYNKIYSENEKTFGGGKPEKVVSDITKYKSSGLVLELGAGEGRNSLFLAEQGFEVTARDISQVGVEKLNKAAQEKGLNIHTEVKDIRTLDTDRQYDIFVCTYVLHHLSREDAVSLIKQMREHTSEDGLNTITTFTENGDFYRNNPDTDNFYPKEGELRELYADWDVLEYEEVENQAFAKRPDGSPMVNVSAKLIARKPKT
jgi:tellurite methyltransferase